MSDTARGLKNVTAYQNRWADKIAKRFQHVYDDRDAALADALRLAEQRSDDYYPAVVSLSTMLTWLARIELDGLTINGTNFVGDTEFATGVSDEDSATKELTWTRTVPGDEDITVIIESSGVADHVVSASWDDSAKELTVTRGTLATAAEVETAIPLDAEAKYIVTVEATGDGTGIPSAGSTALTGGRGGVLLLQIGSTTIDGSTAKCGITSVTETKVTFDFDAKALTSGSTQMLRLWVDDILVHAQALVADSEPWDHRGGNFFSLGSDFELAAGGTLPAPLAKDVQTANITGNYVDDVAGGVYALTHDTTSEAQAGQLTFGDQLVISPAKGPIFEARFKINFAGATFSADQRAVVGLCSAHTNAEDSLDAVVSNLWFRIEGASLNILIESDDGTDDDDNDSGVDIVDNAYVTVRIDASNLDAVKFYVDGALISQTLDAGALTGSNLLQPIFCIQRDAGAEAEVMSIDWYRFRAAR